MFLRGMPHLHSRMRRLSSKERKAPIESKDRCPNFYELPPLDQPAVDKKNNSNSADVISNYGVARGGGSSAPAQQNGFLPGQLLSYPANQSLLLHQYLSFQGLASQGHQLPQIVANNAPPHWDQASSQQILPSSLPSILLTQHQQQLLSQGMNQQQQYQQSNFIMPTPLYPQQPTIAINSQQNQNVPSPWPTNPTFMNNNPSSNNPHQYGALPIQPNAQQLVANTMPNMLQVPPSLQTHAAAAAAAATLPLTSAQIQAISEEHRIRLLLATGSAQGSTNQGGRNQQQQQQQQQNQHFK